jgi:ParB family chromosome partitioning protein
MAWEIWYFFYHSKRIISQEIQYFLSLQEERLKKKALGKGLNALISDFPTDILDEGDESSIQEIPLRQITPNPNQPRKFFDEDKLKELSDSIQENGIIQPILVTQKGHYYQIVVGERRFRAANQAGLHKIPCIVKALEEEKIMELALIENLQREDLNPMETASSYQEIMQKFNLTQEELAKKLGKSRSAIANTLRLLRLPEKIRQDLMQGILKEGHAKAVLMLENVEEMISLRNQIVEGSLSVREAEQLAKNYTKSQKKNGFVKEEKNLEIRDLESRLTEILGTRVQIKGKGGEKGKIEIEYYTLDDFERIKNHLESPAVKKLWI